MADDFGGEFGGTPLAERLLFKTPLYEPIIFTEYELLTLFDEDLRLDGFCRQCSAQRTFRRSKGSLPHNYEFPKSSVFGEYALRCTRHEHHRLAFHYYIDVNTIQKIGQFPSFADIAIDESKDYSKMLDAQDTAEFHKAIGLAAHGVGIGSYVYLRRIFERLIWSRFNQFKDIEKWDESVFKTLRMKEKIEALKNYLPEFLVKNAKLYSILSLGVHELNEKDCLAFFPVLRQSTIWILEQDKKKQEEHAQQKALEQAIAGFTPKAAGGA